MKNPSDHTGRPLPIRVAGRISKRSLRIIVLVVLIALIPILVFVPPALGINQQAYDQAVLLSGLLTGALYVLVASGLTVILGVMKIVNLVHGDFIVLAAYISFWMTGYGWDPILALVISLPLMFVIGLPIQRYLFSKGIKFGTDAPLLVAFGLSNIVEYSMLTAWTAYPRIVTASYSTMALDVGPVIIPIVRLMVLGVALASIVFLTLFLKRTYTGMAIRATSMDWEIASHLGINIDRISMLAYSIGLSLAAIAGAFLGLVFSFSPSSGIPLTLNGFAAIVLGGAGSVPGALIGGIVLGYSQSVGSFFLGNAYTNLIGYVIFFIVLLFRPSGFLGKVPTF
jgi:branched-chain amino acid transport system permease protein